MTRLREALDRAQSGQPDGKSGAEPPDPAAFLVPDAWELDGNGGRPPAAVTAEAVEVSPQEDDAADEIDDLRVGDVEGERDPKFQYAFVTDQNADKLVVGPGVQSVFVEQYRRLGASLHHAQLQKGSRSVMITSAAESEGKTLNAANVALTLSHSYQRNVLLVDADLRRPSVHEVFRLSNKAGLGDTLMFSTPGSKLPLQKVSPNLWVMTAGRPNSDPMSLLISDTMRQFLIDATEQFDWVVVDTPPVALLTDANLLAAMIDLALVVVSAKTTPYPLVRRAIDAIGTQRVLGVVLNRALESESAAGLGYGYYGYGYSYGPRKKAERSSWMPWRRHRRA